MPFRYSAKLVTQVVENSRRAHCGPLPQNSRARREFLESDSPLALICDKWPMRSEIFFVDESSTQLSAVACYLRQGFSARLHDVQKHTGHFVVLVRNEQFGEMIEEKLGLSGIHEVAIAADA